MPILRTRKTQFLFSSFVLDFNAFFVSGKHQPEERTTPIGPIHIVFLLGPTQTSFSFPPAGTPEATSWEQGQMARPQISKLGDSSYTTARVSSMNLERLPGSFYYIRIKLYDTYGGGPFVLLPETID